MVEKVGKEAIVQALKDSPNISEAAERLGIARRTLQSRMREYGIAEGKSGRPRRRISYRTKRRAWGAAATVGVLGLALYAASRRRTVT